MLRTHPARRGLARTCSPLVALLLFFAPVFAQQTSQPATPPPQPPQGMGGVSTGAALTSATRRTVGIVDAKAPLVFENVKPSQRSYK